jgi:ethanolamine ammonia-lyase large subunit
MRDRITLRRLLALASPPRSGDVLAGVAALSEEERVRAQRALAETPLRRFLDECVIPYEEDEITRLIMDSHNARAFAPISGFTVGEFRDWLLSDAADAGALAALAPGLTPEMVAAVSKLMRAQDLILAASRCATVTRFRNSIGLPGRFSTRLQPNHPTDDPAGILASILDGLHYGAGDAVIGINPATDNLENIHRLLDLLDAAISRHAIPTQSCVLTHVTNTLELIQRGAPVDLCFQSIAGTEKANAAFGISLSLLREAREATLSLRRGVLGDNVMYFETGQGSALSADAHHGADQQTLECRAYAVARMFDPLLVNSVVGFIGPEYLLNGKEIIRAGLEDHFCGKLLGLPMGVDICHTNHAEADQDDMDVLLTLLGAAGCTFIMGIPGADDIMLNYQSTSFHDAAYLRRLLGRRPAPEFEAWLETMGIVNAAGELLPPGGRGLLELGEADPFARSTPGTPASPRSEVSRHTEKNSFPLSFRQGDGRHAAQPQVQGDPWAVLRRHTEARIGLGRCGVSLPTAHWLDFRLSHARARDAVHAPFAREGLRARLEESGLSCLLLESDAVDTEEFLVRPDKGRRLSPASRAVLEDYARLHPQRPDISLTISSGLSARAVEEQAAPFVLEFLARLREAGLTAAPTALLHRGRVAAADEVAAALRARLAVMLIGERPGLSSPHSMGAYMTYAPTPGLTDESRNCISNIRGGGLSASEAAIRLSRLAREALERRYSGVRLKDDLPAVSLPSFSPEIGAEAT